MILRTKARLAQTLGHQLRALAEEIAAYEGEIRRVLRTHPDGELDLSLPGAAHITTGAPQVVR